MTGISSLSFSLPFGHDERFLKTKLFVGIDFFASRARNGLILFRERKLASVQPSPELSQRSFCKMSKR
jgi:hypothetical protein